MIVFGPMAIFIMALLFLTQEKVFFTQIRPGKNEKPFRLLKFSTLRDIQYGEDEYSNQKARLTFIGKYLRKTSLDELPQLINVLKGEMSLIGPRPLLMDYLPIYSETQRQRHNIRPGITGWAQVNGRNQISFQQKFEYDLWYIKNRSHWLDFKIIYLTFAKVFKREGIYIDALTTEEKFDGTN